MGDGNSAHRKRRIVTIARLMAGVAIVSLIAASSADAQSTAPLAAVFSSLNIPAQPLGAALISFSRQTRLEVFVDSEVAAGKTSSPVSGQLSPEAALQRMLGGTGLSFRFTNPTTVRIVGPDVPPLAADGSVGEDTLVLDVIDVSGQSGGINSPDGEFQTPESSKYISAARIERFRGTSVGDFISGIPGVLNSDNRNSGALDINIRGMQGQGRVPVIVDGALQESTVWRGYSGIAGRSYLDPDLIGGMTIEKGPSGAADAVGATGGVARVTTIQAGDILKDGKDYGVTLKGSLVGNNVSPPTAVTPGGSEGRTNYFDRPELFDTKGGSGSVAVAKRFDDLGLELVGAYSRRKLGNYFAGTHGPGPDADTGGLNQYAFGEQVLNTSQDNESILLRGVYRFGDGHSLDLAWMRYESDFGELMPSQIIRGDGALQAPLSYVKVDTYTARYRYNPEDNDLIDLKADIWATDSYTRIETPTRLTQPSGAVLNYDSLFASQDERWGVNISNKSDFFGTRVGDLSLIYGASYNYESVSPPDDWDELMATSGYPDFTESRNGWREEASAFVTGELRPYDWLKFDATMRYTQAVVQDRNSGILSADDEYNREEASGFTPIFAVTYEPTPGLQFYARYAEAIRAPSLFEATQGFSFNVDPGMAIKPEHARNKELGINFERNVSFGRPGQLQAKFAYFDNVIDDYISRGFDVVQIDGEDILGATIVNMEKAVFRGFEATVRYDNGRFFAEATANKYTEIEICDQLGVCRSGGTPSGYIQTQIPPDFSATVTLGGRFYQEKLTLGARYTFMGERAGSEMDIGSTTVVIDWEPYSLIDFFGSYKFNDTYKLDFGIDNIFDRYYMDALTLGLMPSPGRTFRAAMTAKF